MKNKFEEITSELKEIFNKNNDLSFYMIVLHANDYISMEVDNKKSIDMGIWPIDIPKILIEDLTIVKGEEATTNFINDIVVLGFESFMKNVEKNNKEDIDKYIDLINKSTEYIKNNPEEILKGISDHLKTMPFPYKDKP